MRIIITAAGLHVVWSIDPMTTLVSGLRRNDDDGAGRGCGNVEK